MSSENLKAALEDARQQLADAVRRQHELGFEVNRLQHLVQTLAASVFNAERLEQMHREMQYQLSITQAIEGLVNGATDPLTPGDVIANLRVYGYDIDRYANPIALVHQTLRRLAEAGRIKEFRGRRFTRNTCNEWLLS